MDSWEEWSGVESGDFPCLKSLIFNRCEKLHRVPEFPTSVNVKSIGCPSLKDSENKPMWVESKQISHCYPLLVLSECGSKFEETANPFQEAQALSSQVQASRSDPIMVESGNRLEETNNFQETQTHNNLVEASNNTPCFNFNDVDMVESGSTSEETTIQVLMSSNTPDSYSDDANMVAPESKLEETTLQKMRAPNSQVQASSSDVLVVECGIRPVETIVQEMQTSNGQLQISMVKANAGNTAPCSYSDDKMIEVNAVNS